MSYDKNSYKTKERIYTVDGVKNKIIVKYGFSYLKGNKEPYFSITATIYEQKKNNRWVYWAGGCLHDEIIERFPKLEPLTRFHLWGQNTANPMYYIENGKFLYECALGIHEFNGKTTDECLEIFKSHILYQDGETIPEIAEKNPELIKGWLENRKFTIQRLFQETMDKFEIERIKI